MYCTVRAYPTLSNSWTLYHVPLLFIPFTPLEHRFLTGGPWSPKGSVKRALGVHKDHKSKVLYPYKPLLVKFRGPPLAFIHTLGGPWKFFRVLGVHGAKMVKNHCSRAGCRDTFVCRKIFYQKHFCYNFSYITVLMSKLSLQLKTIML